MRFSEAQLYALLISFVPNSSEAQPSTKSRAFLLRYCLFLFLLFLLFLFLFLSLSLFLLLFNFSRAAAV